MYTYSMHADFDYPFRYSEFCLWYTTFTAFFYIFALLFISNFQQFQYSIILVGSLLISCTTSCVHVSIFFLFYLGFMDTSGYALIMLSRWSDFLYIWTLCMIPTQFPYNVVKLLYMLPNSYCISSFHDLP
jgi:hypothetical protein